MATTAMSAFVGREEELEGKVKFLEQRMAVLERFVEMRFCETFRDFAVRNQTGGSRDDNFSNNNPVHSNGGGDESGRVGESMETTTEEGKRYSLRKKKPASKSSSKSAVEIQEKELRLSIRRIDSDSIPNSSTGGDTGSPAEGEGQGQDTVEEVKEEYENSSAGGEEGDGDCFTFSGDDDNDADADPIAPDDPNWSSESSEESDREPSSLPPRKKRKKPNPHSGSPTSLSRKFVEPPPEGFKTCELCQRNIREDLFHKHLETWHSRERHLQCRFCEKRYFSTERLQKHEKTHQLDKVGKRCRVTNCQSKEMFFVDAYQSLKHERFCIRRELEAGRRVDLSLMEDVWRRSKNVSLRWPGLEKLAKVWATKPYRKPAQQKQNEGLTKVQIQEIMQHAKKSEDGRWKCSVWEKMIKGDKPNLRRHVIHLHGKQEEGNAGAQNRNTPDKQSELPTDMPT